MKWLNIKKWIISEIEKGNLKPYDKIMTEKELIEKFNTSKMTVRKALSSLIDDYWLFSIKGSGFYVSVLYTFDKITDITNPIPGKDLKYFRSSTSIPERYVDLINIGEKKYNEDEWISFVQIISDSEKNVVGYTINWIRKNEMKISTDLIGGSRFIRFLDNKKNVFLKESIKMNFTKTRTSDKSILLTNSKYVSQKISIFYNKKQEPECFSIYKSLPEFFVETAVRTSEKI